MVNESGERSSRCVRDESVNGKLSNSGILVITACISRHLAKRVAWRTYIHVGSRRCCAAPRPRAAGVRRRAPAVARGAVHLPGGAADSAFVCGARRGCGAKASAASTARFFHAFVELGVQRAEARGGEQRLVFCGAGGVRRAGRSDLGGRRGGVFHVERQEEEGDEDEQAQAAQAAQARPAEEAREIIG